MARLAVLCGFVDMVEVGTRVKVFGFGLCSACVMNLY